MNKLDVNILRKMIRGVAGTHPVEIGCEDCFAQVDRFAETVLDGKEPDEALELVRRHLEMCRSCREEFNALLAALRASR